MMESGIQLCESSCGSSEGRGCCFYERREAGLLFIIAFNAVARYGRMHDFVWLNGFPSCSWTSLSCPVDNPRNPILTRALCGRTTSEFGGGQQLTESLHEALNIYVAQQTAAFPPRSTWPPSWRPTHTPARLPSRPSSRVVVIVVVAASRRGLCAHPNNYKGLVPGEGMTSTPHSHKTTISTYRQPHSSGHYCIKHMASDS